MTTSVVFRSCNAPDEYPCVLSAVEHGECFLRTDADPRRYGIPRAVDRHDVGIMSACTKARFRVFGPVGPDESPRWAWTLDTPSYRIDWISTAGPPDRKNPSARKITVDKQET